MQLFYTNVQAAGVSLSAAYGRAPAAPAVNAMGAHNLAAMYKMHTPSGRGPAVAGGGSGAEERGTVHYYPAPYGLVSAT